MLQLPYPTHLPFVFRLPVPDGRRGSGRSETLFGLFDILFAAAALTLLAPLLITVALAIWISDGAAPLFTQRRLGRGGRTFVCFKFRTMAAGADAHLVRLLADDPQARADWLRDRKLPRDPRITPLGRFLRRTSIDELPQLANVLLGQMSLVGPRPIVAAEVAAYGRRFADYCAQRPGLTGLWQVSGRSRASYRRRLACDRLFARRRSPLLYLRILCATVPAVLSARGAC